MSKIGTAARPERITLQDLSARTNGWEEFSELLIHHLEVLHASRANEAHEVAKRLSLPGSVLLLEDSER